MLAGVLLACLLTPLAGRAEITFDNATSTNGNFFIQFWSHTVGPGTNHYLVVSVASQGATTAAVSYRGTPLARLGARQNGGGPNIELWGGPVTPGSGTVAVFLSTFFASVAAGATSYTGVDPTTPTGAFFSAVGSDASPTVTGIPAAEDDVVVDGLATSTGAGARVPVAPQQQLWADQSTGGAAGNGSAKGTAAAASVTMSWTLGTATPWAIGAVALKPAAFTRAAIDGIRAYRSAVSGSVVEWETLSERGTLGFDLLRRDEETGEYERVNERLLPARLHARNGARYRFLDRGARPGETYRYVLVELEATGNRLRHGPYSVTVAPTPHETEESGSKAAATALGGSPDELATAPSATPREDDAPQAVFTAAARSLSAKQAARIAANKKARRGAQRRKRARRGEAVKISVREAGLYHVDAASIAGALGRPVSAVRRLVAQGRLALTNRGAPVAALAPPGNDGLYFYGEAVDSQYTEENVYWLGVGPAAPMEAAITRRPAPAGGGHFRHASRAEGHRYALTHLFDDPDDDYWMWDFRFEGEDFPSYREDFPVETPGVAPTSAETATLTVRLHGGSAAPHRASIYLNGAELGSTEFTGLAPHTATFEVPVGQLLDGENAVQIGGHASGDPERPSVFYIDDISVDYPRRYVAEDGALVFDAGGRQVVTVGGFSSPDIEVFDLANPRRPRRVVRTTIDGSGGNHRVSFRAAGDARTYLALDSRAVRSPESIVADRSSALRARHHRVDYLVVTATDMLEAAQALADYRATQGLRAMVVDVEDVYDEFSHGIRDADAIWAMLRYAYTRWRAAPRYVVLAGEGSFDYKDHLGHGDAVIPTLLAPTPNGLFASDNLYADVAGNDRVPEMAIGRLPVIDAAELAGVVAKIKRYEAAAGAWRTHAIVAADAPDAAGDFTRDSEALAAHFPAHYTIEPVHLETMARGEARARVLEGLDAGIGFLNFFGHSGHLGLGNANLLTAADTAVLANGASLPVVTAFTCLAGQFGLPGQESVAEALLVAPGGGAAAVWAPSGLSQNSRARVLAEGFYAAAFDAGARAVGDAVLAAQARYADDGAAGYLLDIYNLIGDPATLLR